jgi:hypothetical protein
MAKEWGSEGLQTVVLNRVVSADLMTNFFRGGGGHLRKNFPGIETR